MTTNFLVFIYIIGFVFLFITSSFLSGYWKLKEESMSFLIYYMMIFWPVFLIAAIIFFLFDTSFNFISKKGEQYKDSKLHKRNTKRRLDEKDTNK